MARAAPRRHLVKEGSMRKMAASAVLSHAEVHTEMSKLEEDRPVVTCGSVPQGAEVVNLVIHQYDDTWQFVCRSPVGEDDIAVVHFDDLLRGDGALESIRSLRSGQFALRRDPSADSGWEIHTFGSDSELDSMLSS
jgi:hypothetical protein